MAERERRNNARHQVWLPCNAVTIRTLGGGWWRATLTTANEALDRAAQGE